MSQNQIPNPYSSNPATPAAPPSPAWPIRPA